MIPDQLIPLAATAIMTFSQALAPMPTHVLASHEMSLDNRYSVKSVSDVFEDNILLNLAYMRGLIQSNNKVTWEEVKKPFHYEFKLEPNKTFAYHEDVLSEYKDSLVKTTQAHFNAQEGFKTDGYLFGDGVCHLASLIYWVSKDANLDAKAPTNHDFMAIPEIDKQFGVSIYSNNKQQNLYVTNNTDKNITFYFDFADDKLRVSVLKENI
jgi:hypothetical protein